MAQTILLDPRLVSDTATAAHIQSLAAAGGSVIVIEPRTYGLPEPTFRVINPAVVGAVVIADSGRVRRFFSDLGWGVAIVVMTFVRGVLVAPQIAAHAVVHPRSAVRIERWLVRDW